MSNKNWLNATIAQGLGGLVLLRLPNQPPEELIKQTAKVWVIALESVKLYGGWNEEDDKWRIEKGFQCLYAECDRFPAPKMLIERMPKRKAVEALPAPALSDEQVARNLARLAKIKRLVKPSYRKKQRNGTL